MKKWSSQWTQEAWKKFNGVSTRDLAIPVRCSTMQLSYEATDVGSRSIVDSYVPVKEMCVNDIWNKSYMNCGNEIKTKKWSSQWKQFMKLRKEALNKFSTSTGFEPIFFQSSLRNCINCVHCEDHFFVFISAVHIWFISYIINLQEYTYLGTRISSWGDFSVSGESQRKSSSCPI